MLQILAITEKSILRKRKYNQFRTLWREARGNGKHKKCDVSLTDNHVCKEV